MKITQKGNFDRSVKYLAHLGEAVNKIDFNKYGIEGVEALMAATPKKTGLTAASWYYTIKNVRGGVVLSFNNSNAPLGVPVAILLFYGHATKNGGYVEGIDYINPALTPVFEKLAADAWREIQNG